eukprot:4427840-Alexandrium_andersonii.AAC.1
MDVDPRDMLVRVSDAISRVEKGMLPAKDGLTMAVRLTQWARGHFKIAKGGRNKMREAIIRLTLASHDRLLETGQQGPAGPGQPELNAND